MVGSDTENGREEESLPLDIMINILKRVPVKSLIQFKSVSKDWKKIIETPHFTAEHCSHSASNNAFLLLHRIPDSRPRNSSFCLIGSDFEVHDLEPLDFASPSHYIVGSCNGLLLIEDFNDRKKLSVWNPATRQVRQVTGTLTDLTHLHLIGFGFCEIVNDYKIVRISMGEPGHEDDIIELDDVTVKRAEVYSLTAGSWREVSVANLKILYLSPRSVTANGAIFWVATVNSDSGSNSEFVVSFDIGHEMFTLLKGPPFLPSSPNSVCNNILAVSDNKLVMFRHFIVGMFESCYIDLWVMEDANACEAGEGWIKMCSVKPSSRMLHPLCIWRDEIVCREECPRENDDRYNGVKTVLSLFNPRSNELKNMPVRRYEIYYSVLNYAESLVSIGNIQQHEL